MVFLFLDYINYRKKAGRYRRSAPDNLMAYAWNCPLPDPLLRALHSGDIILFQSFASITSWLIMYGTQSHVSHIGVFVKPDKILHSLPRRGSILEDIKNTYGQEIRIMPLHIPHDGKNFDGKIAEKYCGIRYSHKAIFNAAINIIFARSSPFFRWSLFFDFAIVTLVLDLILFCLTGFFGISALIPVYLAIITVNLFRWRINPPDLFAADVGAPCLGFLLARHLGGHPLVDPRYFDQSNRPPEDPKVQR